MKSSIVKWIVIVTVSMVGVSLTRAVSGQEAVAQVSVSEIDGPIDHNHCTTRQFQHMSFQYEGIWFVFYSDGKYFQYQTSDDGGKSWAKAKEAIATAPNGSTSFDVLRVGETVYVSHVHYPLGRYNVNAPYAKDPARRAEYTSEGRIKVGRIDGRSIHWKQDVDPGFVPDYCNLVRDSNGFLWVFTRENETGIVHRSRAAHDVQSWGSKQTCIGVQGRHALDAAALDDGKLYAVSMLTTGGKLFGNLYDGSAWVRDPILLADGLTTVAGDDRRMAVEFDPTQKKLHLIYVDADNRLRYRYLNSPYGQSDWSPALSEVGLEIAENVFTAALSVDTSTAPYGLVVTYGIEKYLGQDKRRRSGELFIRRFGGEKWLSRPLLVSQPGTIHNWYPNVNHDASKGSCVLFSRSIDKRNMAVPLAVMASVTTILPKDTEADPESGR